MIPYSIRLAVLSDAAGIAAILHGLGWFKQINAEAVQATTERIRTHLEICFADRSHSVYVAESPEKGTLGYANVHWLPYLLLAGPEGYVSELFLALEARGQGIGRQLLETVKAEARQRGCVRLSLINNRKRESYLRGFYNKAGWEERTEYANFVINL